MRRSFRLFAGLMAMMAMAVGAAAQDSLVKRVTFPAEDGRERLTTYALWPDAPGRRPAVIAMHGCGGPLARYGGLSARHLDWGLRLRSAGFVVLFPDSFGSRGFRSLCRVRPRPVLQRHRVSDAFAARAWLAAQPDVDPKRIALLGWSNGGGTVLRTAIADRQRLFRLAISFYPGCRALLWRPDRRPKIPVTILIGGADDWTLPGYCIDLSKAWGTSIKVYPGAYHSFDTPGSRVRVRRGMAFTPDGSGNVHVGTDPRARAEAIRDVMRILRAL